MKLFFLVASYLFATNSYADLVDYSDDEILEEIELRLSDGSNNSKVLERKLQRLLGSKGSSSRGLKVSNFDCETTPGRSTGLLFELVRGSRIVASKIIYVGDFETCNANKSVFAARFSSRQFANKFSFVVCQKMGLNYYTNATYSIDTNYNLLRENNVNRKVSKDQCFKSIRLKHNSN